MNRYFVCVVALFGVVACGDKLVIAAPTTTTTVCMVHSVTVIPASASIHVGDTLRVTAEVSSCGGAPTSGVVWRSTNAAVARVDSLAGLITALAAGTSVVTATETVDPTQAGAMSVTVLP